VTSGIEAVSGQGNAVQYYDLAPFLDLLHPGTNTIAVILNNVFSSWDDVAFDVSLKAVASAGSSSTAAINSISRTPGTSQINLNLTVPQNSVWRLEAASNLNFSMWSLVTLVTNNSGGSIWVQDTSQNSTRYYRLVP
jgi:hypothetical protein